MPSNNSYAFIDEITSNFQDVIRNIVFGLQRYSNEFAVQFRNPMTVVDNYNNIDDDLIGFLMCEASEIMRNKILRTSVDICRSIRERYVNAIYRISRQGDASTYMISEEVFQYLEDMCRKAVHSNSDFIRYHKNDKDVSREDIYEFKMFLDEVVEHHYATTSKDHKSKLKMTKEQLVDYLSEFNKTLDDYMLIMKLQIESCSSCYMAAHVIRDMIECMALACHCIASIQPIID